MTNFYLNRYLQWFVWCLFISISSTVHATTKAQAVKAGFVYNFTKFTHWPEAVVMAEGFHLCVIGDDGLDGALEALYDKPVAGRSILLKHLNSEDDLSDCHLAYIENDKRTIVQALKQLRHLPVLTISEFPDFTDYGGIISLVRDEKRVGFNVNLKSAQAVGLTLSAQLLKLAKTVKGLK